MEEMTVNAAGGRQHKVDERFEALFPLAEIELARLRAYGHDVLGYEDDNYTKIPADQHVDRARRHLAYYKAGIPEDGGDVDEHLVHALCRIAMAVEMKKKQKQLEELQKEFGYGKGVERKG